MKTNHYDKNEAIEIRFKGNRQGNKYQLLAMVRPAGNVEMHLRDDPAQRYGKALDDLHEAKTNPITLPMKAYENWQVDLINWINHLTAYTITDIK